MLGKFAAAAVVAVASAQSTLKIGAALHSTGTGSHGRHAYTAFDAWVKNQTGLAYTVDLTIEDFYETAAKGSGDVLEYVIGNFTAAGSAKLVDVLVPPYGSANTKKALGFIADGWTGSVMIWGGASDSIFAAGGPCDGKSYTCFGFFTVGSSYMTSGLTAIDHQASDNLKVLFVENLNPFSHSVCDGAETTVSGLAKLEKHGERIICNEKTDPTADELDMIAGNASEADVIVICGHNGFVEPVIKKIGATTTPKAIIATNALNPSAIEDIGDKSNCLMMPTQWAEADEKDDVVGWTSADFTAAAGGSATYHAASAGGSAVMIAQAMNADPDVAKFAETLAGLAEISTFYGPVDFEGLGKITKPMYTQQRQDGNTKIVAPSTATTHHAQEADMMFPLSSCSGWGADNTTAADGGSSQISGAAGTSAVLGLFLTLAVQAMQLASA